MCTAAQQAKQVLRDRIDCIIDSRHAHSFTTAIYVFTYHILRFLQRERTADSYVRIAIELALAQNSSASPKWARYIMTRWCDEIVVFRIC
jgi:hypothetical protein